MPIHMSPFKRKESTVATAHLWWHAAVKAVAAVAGLKYGFDFGMELGSVLLGVVVGLNAAVFCYLMAASLTGLLSRRHRSDDAHATSSPEHAEDPRTKA